MTMLLSGPSSSASPLRTALAGAGLADILDNPTHGLADNPETRWTGDYDDDRNIIPGTGVIEALEPEGPTSWLQCEGDVDRAVSVAVQFGWRLRAHWVAIEAAEPMGGMGFGGEDLTPEQRLSRVESDLAILKGLDDVLPGPAL